MTATYDFLPWVRTGLIASVRDPALVGQLAIDLEVDIEGATSPAQLTARLRGPADVRAIDPGAIVRTLPTPGATAFEPNLFPAIDFARADFPWLFTPAGVADAAGGLAPWLCLIVAAVQDGVSLSSAVSGSLPMLAIGAPADPSAELMPLDESWAWAHAQVSSSAPIDDAALGALLTGPGPRAVSRLVCPRRLEPDRRYIACLVPAWASGVAAGLGRDQPADPTTPAWAWPPPANIELPVYFAWEFTTGDGGDFASLAAALHPNPVDPAFGTRPVDVSDPGAGLTPQPGLLLDVGGALVALEQTQREWPAPARARFESEVTQLLERSATPPGAHPALIGPPLRGGSTGAGEHLSTAPAWVKQLNLDPRNRIAAGLADEVVRKNQEQLVTSAWQQLGEIDRVESSMRRIELSDVVAARLHAKHLVAASDGVRLQLTRPAHGRTLLTQADASRQTLAATVRSSALGGGVLTSSFRRMSSVQGAIARRAVDTTSIHAIVEQLDRGALDPAPPAIPPRGTVLLDDVSRATSTEVATRVGFDLARPQALTQSVAIWRDRATRGGVAARLPVAPAMMLMPTTAATHVSSSAALSGIRVPPLPDRLGPVSPIEVFAAASAAHQHYLIDVLGALPRPRRRPPLIVATEVAALTSSQAVVDATNPRPALVRELGARLTGVTLDPQSATPFGPRKYTIEIDDAAFDLLTDLGLEAIVPGLGALPRETSTLLRTNRAFVESVMVGLNQAMIGELAWRRFPIDRVGTIFKSFWKAGAPDIPDLSDATWHAGDLGVHAVSAEPVMFVVRGALVERYPNAIVTAVKAVVDASGRRPGNDPPVVPRFQLTVGPDVLLVAFDLGTVDRDALRGRSGDPTSPGWYFVIQEHPTEPRFGLDAAVTPGANPASLSSWSALNWGHFANDAASLADLQHLPLAGRVANLAPAIDGVLWGRDAGDMAFITLRRPASVAFHASTLIQE